MNICTLLTKTLNCTYPRDFIHFKKSWCIVFITITCITSQITKFMGPIWGPSGSCRPQMVPMLAPWTLLSGIMCIKFPLLKCNVVFLSLHRHFSFLMLHFKWEGQELYIICVTHPSITSSSIRILFDKRPNESWYPTATNWCFRGEDAGLISCLLWHNIASRQHIQGS